MSACLGYCLIRPVVILAEGNKEDMDRQLRRALTGSSIEWHTRQVPPTSAV